MGQAIVDLPVRRVQAVTSREPIVESDSPRAGLTAVEMYGRNHERPDLVGLADPTATLARIRREEVAPAHIDKGFRERPVPTCTALAGETEQAPGSCVRRQNAIIRREPTPRSSTWGVWLPLQLTHRSEAPFSLFSLFIVLYRLYRFDLVRPKWPHGTHSRPPGVCR
jgi:hypothetical protein